MPTSNKPRPRRNQRKETEIVNKGFDAVPADDDKESQKTRDLSVPLNEYYHQLFFSAITELEKKHWPLKMGSRRKMAAEMMKEAIEKLAKKAGIKVEG